jgi:magnesium and cobalt transporter
MDRDSHPTPGRSNWFDRLAMLLMREPGDREQLVELLQGALDRNLIDAEALGMIEGVLEVSELSARDIMIPRAQIETIDAGAPRAAVLTSVIEAGHSRFPVIDGDKDEVIGILHAKDLLRLFSNGAQDLRGLLRPAVFIPESKRLNVLLREFRASRNHIAIVVDEYGGVTGIVTIEDEYDFDDAEDAIVAQGDGSYRVLAEASIEDLNAALGTAYGDAEQDTVGGLVVRHFGHVPKRNETVVIGAFRFQVLRADRRGLRSVLVERAARAAPNRVAN